MTPTLYNFSFFSKNKTISKYHDHESQPSEAVLYLKNKIETRSEPKYL